MGLIELTKSQADKYIAQGAVFIDDLKLGQIVACKEILQQVSDMDYVFKDEFGALCFGHYLSKAWLPFVGYVPKEEADYLCKKFSCLVGKKELLSGCMITEMKVERVRNMTMPHGYLIAMDDDWAVFAKVQKTVKTISGEMEISEWILFDNTKNDNGGVPTLCVEDFEAAAQSDLSEALGDNDTYHDLRYAFLLYYSLGNRTFSYRDNYGDNEVSIIYDTKPAWESCHRWYRVEGMTVYNLYVDTTHVWLGDWVTYVDVDRLMLSEYIKDDSKPLANEMRQMLRCSDLSAGVGKLGQVM